MKYYAEITGWGDEAKAFLKELNYIILFNDNAVNLTPCVAAVVSACWMMKLKKLLKN